MGQPKSSRAGFYVMRWNFINTCEDGATLLQQKVKESTEIKTDERLFTHKQ